jgi:hypothetical protein
VRLVIPLLTLLRARIAAPLLRAEREKHSRELAKYSERLAELAAEARAAEADHDGVIDESIIACDILGIDRDRDYDYLATLRAVMARANTTTIRTAPAVPEARRMAILRAVDARPFATSAARIGNYLSRNEEATFNGAGGEHIASDVRRLIDEGYLTNITGVRGGPLAFTEKGRAALAGDVRVSA